MESRRLWRHRWQSPTLVLPLGVALLGLVSCGNGASDPEPSCLATAASTDCTPEYVPTYDNVFRYTLSSKCGVPGCHSAPNPKGNLELDQKDTARDNLLARNPAGERRVIPNDVKCGKAIVRLESEGEPWSMPPSNHLSDGQLCSVRQWIASGAMP